MVHNVCSVYIYIYIIDTYILYYIVYTLRQPHAIKNAKNYTSVGKFLHTLNSHFRRPKL